MPLKKLIKGLEASLKVEREIHPSTKLGVWFHNFKMRNIEYRINDIKKQLNCRFSSSSSSFPSDNYYHGIDVLIEADVVVITGKGNRSKNNDAILSKKMREFFKFETSIPITEVLNNFGCFILRKHYVFSPLFIQSEGIATFSLKP